MPLLNRRRRRKLSSLTGSRTVATDFDRHILRDQLQAGLAELDNRAAAAAGPVLELGLLLQVLGTSSYDTFRTAREAACRQQAAPWGIAAWPPQLDAGQLAVLLLPITAGR